MNMIVKLSPNRPIITLRDLVKPNLNKHEERAIKSALKNASKDQDIVRKKAKKINERK